MPVRKEAAPGNQTAQPTVAELPPDTDQAAKAAGPVDEPETERTYHDSQTGRKVDVDGHFVDGLGDGQVERNQIVADDWPSNR